MRRFLFFELFALAILGAAPAVAALRADMEKSRADLAASKQFYLELRVQEKKVVLCHSGAALATYPFDKIEIGYHRILGFRREPPHGAWIGLTLKGGTLAPPRVLQRVTIIPGNAATLPTPEEAGIVPPTMTEIMPVPQSYRMEFGNELSVLVDLKGKIPGAAAKTEGRWSSRWQAFLEALGFRPSPKVQLRIEMNAEQGAALYRCLPESPSMLVLP